MAFDIPLYSKTTDLPIFAKSDDEPMFGDPDNCECCGGGTPYSTCCNPSQPQPTALVIVTGTLCAEAQGNYAFQSCDVLPDGSLGWVWRLVDDADWELRLRCSCTFDAICARITYQGYYVFNSPTDCPIEGGTHDVTAEVSCDAVTGYLNGIFDLVGIDLGDPYNCLGSTATVELNP